MLKRLGKVAAVMAITSLAGAQSKTPEKWVGTWAASPMAAQGGFSVRVFGNTSLREIVHVSNGGTRVRVRFTNEFGTDPLTVNDAHVALSAGGGATQAGTDHLLTFGGAASVRIPPGAAMNSDAVAMTVAPLSDLAISFYVPAQVMRTETYHAFADQDNFQAEGDVAGAETLNAPVKVGSWYFVDGVDVAAEEGSRAVVALGD